MENYEEKYLKYKQKYLALKNMRGGIGNPFGDILRGWEHRPRKYGPEQKLTAEQIQRISNYAGDMQKQTNTINKAFSVFEL